MTDFGHNDHLVKQGERMGLPGIQYLYHFDNDFGASVVRGYGSYGEKQGLWELALIKWTDDEYRLVYNDDLFSDVIGWLNDDEVNKHLDAIENLPTFHKIRESY